MDWTIDIQRAEVQKHPNSQWSWTIGSVWLKLALWQYKFRGRVEISAPIAPIQKIPLRNSNGWYYLVLRWYTMVLCWHTMVLCWYCWCSIVIAIVIATERTVKDLCEPKPEESVYPGHSTTASQDGLRRAMSGCPADLLHRICTEHGKTEIWYSKIWSAPFGHFHI